ncbi:hypothetical protein [Leptolyngbya ohadii]|uniref:hypothetical protein n=1 Tax=Leptolyngbya ohadii TaxID=1962290 RepID=UPI00117B29E3|nr:hypothetical protein [Leptolyngbya ohadii]
MAQAVVQKSTCIELQDVQVERLSTLSRVSLIVQDRPIWFESSDAILEPAIEAFANVLLLPALNHGYRIKINTPIDADWLQGMQKLSPIYGSWWGYSSDCPIDAAETYRSTHRSNRTGICFTGGVDSFFSLQSFQAEVSRLVFAWGYDIPLKQPAKMSAFRRSLDQIAAHTQTAPIVISTNLREHPLIRSISWERLHGSALTALGILLSGEIGRLIIPPSYAMFRLQPWGSHPETDSLYSTSRCKMLHHETDEIRFGRIKSIASNPLVQQHLRICYADTSAMNCSACEKCVMTMLALNQLRVFHACQTFDRSIALEDRVRQLNQASPHLLELWRDLATTETSSPIHRAIQSKIRPQLLKQTFRKLKQFLR